MNRERSDRKNGEIQLFMTFNHRNNGNNIHNALPWFSKDFLSIFIYLFLVLLDFRLFRTEATHVRKVRIRNGRHAPDIACRLS